MRPLLIASAVALGGCAPSILPDYEAARQTALTDPGPAPDSWEPDAVLYLSLPLLNDVVRTLLTTHGDLDDQRDIKAPLGLTASVTPSLDVKTLKLVRSQYCTNCLTVITDLDGVVGWSLPPTGGEVPVSAHIIFDVEFTTKATGPMWKVSAKPADVRSAEVTVGALAANLDALVGQDLTAWLEQELLKQVPDIELAEFDTSSLPLRGVAVEPSNKGLRVAMLSRSPSPVPLQTRNAAPERGFAFEISQDSLVDLVRAAAFEQGEVGYDVVVDPHSLSVDGDAFSMGVRLWRIKGKGWWRDYTVEGVATVDGDEVALEAGGVTEGDKSPGAVWVDPLAALAEGKILDIIADAITTSLPAAHSTSVAEMDAGIQLDHLSGTRGALTVYGDMTLGAAPTAEGGKEGTKSRPRGDRKRPPQ